MTGLYIVLVVAFVGTVTAVAPKPCCTPKQWTGSFSEEIGSSTIRRHGHDRRGFSVIGTNITADYTNSRLAMQSYIIRGRAILNYHVIADYKNKKAYMINVKRSKCTEVALKKKMMSNCIPANAKYFGSVTLGSRAKGLKVNSWGMGIKKRAMEVFASISVTDACIPVGEMVTGTIMHRTGFMASIGYHDITAGVRDPSVFNIPAFCKKSLSAGMLVDGMEPNVLTYMLHKFSEEL